METKLMPDQASEFHDHVVATLATLVTGQNTIRDGQSQLVARLDKVNGSISHLYERSNALALELVNHQKEVLVLLAKHEKECPALPELKEIRRKLESGDFHGSVEVRARLDQFNNKAREHEATDKAEKAVQEAKSKIFDKYGIPVLKAIGIIIAVLFFEHVSTFSKLFMGIFSAAKP